LRGQSPRSNEAISKGHDIADDDSDRWLKPSRGGQVDDLGEGAGDDLFSGGRAGTDEGDRGVGGAAGGEQARDDAGERGLAHEDHQGVDGGSEAGPVHARRVLASVLVARNDREGG
jgi:hypothetical protein